MVINILLGVGAGVVALFQTTVNGQLRKYTITPYAAALISFLIGLALLFLIDLAQSGPVFPSAAKLASVPWWGYTGGLMGLVMMTSFIILVPIIGPVQIVAMPILGQIIMGMLIDQFGWFYSERDPNSFWNFLGMIILVAGVFCVVVIPGIRKGTPEDHANQTKKWIGRIMAVLAGMLMAVQVAINGHLGVLIGSTVHAALISFMVGIPVLLIINAVQGTYKNMTFPIRQRAPFWIWLGGIFGALYVLFNAINAPMIGTGAVVVLTLLGQIFSSTLVEQFGWFRTPKNRIKLIQIIGLAGMLIGVILIKLV